MPLPITYKDVQQTQGIHHTPNDTFPVNLPASVTEGDFLVAFVVAPWSSTLVADGSWNIVDDIDDLIRTYWKIAGPSESASYDFTQNNFGSTADVFYNAVVVSFEGDFDPDDPSPRVLGHESDINYGFGHGFGHGTVTYPVQGFGSDRGDSVWVTAVAAIKNFPVILGRGSWTEVDPDEGSEVFDSFTNISTEDSNNRDQLIEVHYGDALEVGSTTALVHTITFDAALNGPAVGIDTSSELYVWSSVLIVPPIKKPYGWGIRV